MCNAIDLQDLNEALAAKVPEWPEGVKPSTFAQLESDCPDCDETMVFCCHINLSGIDYDDHFAHVCCNPACQYHLYSHEYTTDGQETGTEHICDFCKRNTAKPAEHTQP